MLAAFLGVPAALAGCTSRTPPPLPAGEIVGASHGIGHKLRDRERFIPSADAWKRVGVVIVGGGVAGLAAAWRFLKADFHDFLLLELEAAPGGTSRSGVAAGIPCPWGGHYVPAPMATNRLLITLLDEMGVLEGRDAKGEPVVAEPFLCRDPQERIFYKGRWYEGHYLHAGASPEDRAQLKAFHAEIDRWVAWRDARGRRAFAIPMAAGSDDADVTALDRMTMAEWLDRRNWTSPRLRWLVNYACRDDYGSTLHETSAWAGVFYYASRLRQPGTETQPLISWPEGNGRPVVHLYQRVRANVRLGLAAAEIVPTDPRGRCGVDVIAVDAAGQSIHGFHAGQVLFAAPHFLSRYLVRPYREHAPRHVAAFEYGTWLVANLTLKDRPAGQGFPLAWDNVLYESPSLGYVVATHQQGVDRGPTVFTYYYPFCDESPSKARSRLLGMDWQSCADVVLTDLAPAHPEIRALVERLDVMRWGHAMIRPRPGFIWGGARATAARPYRGIHFANTDLSGIPLFEEALYHGVRAAEEVLVARGVSAKSML
ncbi:MAG TPA: NAD(P)-binding protein [Gemmataceae bacterium]|nr:NAD(P)-binding protein [Gemmataceae bacterium]